MAASVARDQRAGRPRDALDPGTEALGRVVAELEQAQLRARPIVSGTRTTSAIAIGRTCSQLRPFRLPVSHTVARWASKISARVRR